MLASDEFTSLHVSEKVMVLVLKGVFNEYRILGWQV